jgi:hypothetical protein
MLVASPAAIANGDGPLPAGAGNSPPGSREPITSLASGRVAREIARPKSGSTKAGRLNHNPDGAPFGPLSLLVPLSRQSPVRDDSPVILGVDNFRASILILRDKTMVTGGGFEPPTKGL